MSLDLSTLPPAVLLALGVAATIQFALVVTALAVLARTDRSRVLAGRKWLWVLIILAVNTLGAIAFLAFGRRATPAADDDAAAAAQPDVVARTVTDLYGERA